MVIAGKCCGLLVAGKCSRVLVAGRSSGGPTSIGGLVASKHKLSSDGRHAKW